MSLPSNQVRHLRSLAHHLKPVVWIGQKGLSDAVFEELDIALGAHELVKIKVGNKCDKETLADLCERGRAELVSSVGGKVCLFRRNHKDPKIPLPPAK